jgi:AcrR family transcriptional regulator
MGKAVLSNEPKARRVRRKPEERRRQIVEAAARLIAESGFNAVSFADIAAACGVAKSLVQYYYPSMSRLLIAVLEYRDALAVAAIPEISVPPRDPADVRGIAVRMIEHSLSFPELVRLYHVLATESLSATHPAHDYFETRSRQMFRSCREIFAWKPNPAHSALTFIAFFEGIERLWLRDPSIDIRAIFQEFIDGFIR